MKTRLCQLMLGLSLALVPFFARGADERPILVKFPVVSVDGVNCGNVMSWSGAQPRGTVATTSGSKKHISSVTYEPLVLESALPLAPPLAAVLDGFLQGQSAGVTVILGMPAPSGPAPEIKVNNARLIQFEMSELDSASKGHASARLTFSVQSTETNPSAAVNRSAARIRAALASNFMITIDGLPTQRVAKVSALTATAREGAGLRSTSISNLILEISAVDQAAWTAWRDQFLLQGKNSDSDEKNGTLKLLSPTMKETFATFSLSHIGLVSLKPSATSSDKISRVTAELYVESVRVGPAGEAVKDGAADPAPVADNEAPDIRDMQADIEFFERRQKSLQQIIANQEAEKRGLEPNAKEAWEKSRLPVVNQQLQASNAELAAAVQRLKELHAELDAIQKPTPVPTKPAL